MAELVWHGAVVREKVARSAAAGIDETMARCTSEAEAEHPEFPPASAPYERYAERSHEATEGIQIFEHAHEDGDVVRGSWGDDSDHALFLEIGTSLQGPTVNERAAAAAGDMDLIPAPIGPLMAPRPFLRPAADREYPLLSSRIGALYRGDPLP